MTLETLKPAARARLDDDLIIWFTTVSPAGQPQTSPVWFVVDGGDILVYSKRSVRLANVATHPKVAMNLDGDGEGGAIVTIEGTARIDDETPSPDEHDAFFAKYRKKLESYEWTIGYFAEHYPVPVRIAVDRVRAF
ncbi:MAG TPA: TIGR03667 family PPOX class F420-dependent oxidoreductase [Acidimicrobiia bacterium]|jgi:PPOX class probable F420-dependent enzyme